MLNKVFLTSKSVDEILKLTIQMKAIEQHFSADCAVWCKYALCRKALCRTGSRDHVNLKIASSTKWLPEMKRA